MIYKNRLKLGKLLNKLEKVPFLPNFERGGENEENMLQKFSKHVKIQVYSTETILILSNKY